MTRGPDTRSPSPENTVDQAPEKELEEDKKLEIGTSAMCHNNKKIRTLTENGA